MTSTFIIIALVIAFALLMYRFATEVKQNEVLRNTNLDMGKETSALHNQVSQISDLLLNAKKEANENIHKIADAIKYPEYCVRDFSTIFISCSKLASEKDRLASTVIEMERTISNLGTLKDNVTRLEGQIKQIEESRDEYVDEYHKTKAELNRFKFPQCHNLVYGQQILLDHNYAYFRRIDGDAIIVMRPEQTTPQGGSFMLKAMDNKESVISLQDFEAGLVAGTIVLTSKKSPVIIKDAGEKV